MSQAPPDAPLGTRHAAGGPAPSAVEGTQPPPWRRPRSRIIVVLPACNEEANLPTLLERIDQAMYENGEDYQVLVVDDGSGDATARVAEEHARHMPIAVLRHKANQGLVSEDGFQCMVDILLKLRTMGVIFGEVPLILRYDLKGGASKLRISTTILRTLRLALRRRLGR